MSVPSSGSGVRPSRRWRRWCKWQGGAGRLRPACRRPQARSAWTTMQSRCSPHLAGLVSPPHLGLTGSCPPPRPATASPDPAAAGKRGGSDAGGRLSVAALRRLLPALREAQEHCAKRLGWSRLRRRHQADAQRHHRIRRARQAPRTCPPGPPLRVPRLPELTPAPCIQSSPLLLRSRRGRPSKNYRLLGEGIRWVMRTGGSWRALPAPFGPWQTVAGCSHRWRHAGVWERIRQILLPPDVLGSSSA
jgi:Putative transposase of IS4/5 family (DUF4096)